MIKIDEKIDHTQQAIDAFGTTYYRTRAGFMLKDGRLLDLTYDGQCPREDHRNIRDAFYDMDLDSESDYLIEFMNEGNIRLIPEVPGIDIAVEPTDRQYAALKYYIDFFIGRKKYFGVQFSNKNGDQVDWKDYSGFVSAQEIILDIKDYFENKLTEGWYDDSVPMVEYLGNNQAAIWQAIRDHFVVDNHPVSGPSFLLPNGDFIDLSSSYKPEASFEDFPAHAEVEDFLQFSGLSDVSGDIIDGSPSIQGLGAIRLNDLEDNNYIELPESNLTLAQYDSLEGWLDKNSRKRNTVVVSDLGFNNYIEYDYSDYLPEDIIKKIKRYYSSSHLYESTIEFNSFPPNDLLDYIKSNFNSSDYYSEGQSYILPDGEFLNLWDGAHIGVDDTLYEKGFIKEDPYFSGKLVLMDDYNSIRMSDGKYIQTDPYIELPKKLPSNAQLNSLLDFLDSLTDESVWVGVRGNKNAGASYNLENVLPEQVIKNIKRFYSSGVLYEAIERAEDPRKKSFQNQIDNMEGDLKVTLYEAKNGHNYGAEYLEDLYRQSPSLCGKMLASIQILKIMKNATPTKYSKYLTHGIYELRASVATNEARELYFFSLGNEVFITNGFTKKSQKAPEQEIRKAERLMDEYNSFRRG